MDKSTNEEYLSQSLQTNNKRFKIDVTFLTAYNGIFNITKKIISFTSKNPLLKRILFKLKFPKDLTK